MSMVTHKEGSLVAPLFSPGWTAAQERGQPAYCIHSPEFPSL